MSIPRQRASLGCSWGVCSVWVPVPAHPQPNRSHTDDEEGGTQIKEIQVPGSRVRPPGLWNRISRHRVPTPTTAEPTYWVLPRVFVPAFPALADSDRLRPSQVSGSSTNTHTPRLAPSALLSTQMPRLSPPFPLPTPQSLILNFVCLGRRSIGVLRGLESDRASYHLDSDLRSRGRSIHSSLMPDPSAPS